MVFSNHIRNKKHQQTSNAQLHEHWATNAQLDQHMNRVTGMSSKCDIPQNQQHKDNML